MIATYSRTADPFADHRQKCVQISHALAALRAQGGRVRLAKSTSNLFRYRSSRPSLAVNGLDSVLAVDSRRLFADVEGMATYETLVDATLPHGAMPTVVPELKTITVGGAVSGVAIESSSFRYGLVHEGIEELEVLLADGSTIVCSPERNQDLFYGIPNSYGTLGYILRARVEMIPVKPFVHLVHRPFFDAGRFFEAIQETAADPAIDFLDGTVFGRAEMYVTSARFVDHAPHVSDYTWRSIYYQSIREKPEDWLTVRDYIWRWDTDWFWCSKKLYAQHPAVRLLATRRLLNSRTYQKVMRLSYRLLPQSAGRESVIQDVDIPIAAAREFLAFLLDEIRITPIWICPFRARDPFLKWPLFALDDSGLYINFGFWDSVPSNHVDGHFNRAVERKAAELGGKKGLYSTVWYDRETFDRLYGQSCYQRLKQKYDPEGVFPSLWEKCVERV
jgi:FAD/FMN-containing dehydrogenase